MTSSMPPASAWVPHPWITGGGGRIRFGAGVSARASLPDWATRLTLVRALEDLGYDSHWLPDHPVYTADCWATLAALAVATSRIRLGPLVSCVMYRSPSLLARQAADVDRLSGGRLVLGLGAGHFVREFGELGLPYPPGPERARMVAETVEVVNGLWGTPPGSAGPPDASYAEPFAGLPGPPPLTYRGSSYQLDEGLLRHEPVQRPRVPVLIAGGGERTTLRQLARYADASNFGIGMPGSPQGDEEIRSKLAALRRHCEDLGRPFASVLPTHFLNPVVLAETPSTLAAKRAALPPVYHSVTEGLYATPEEAIAFYRPLVAAGLRYFIPQLATYDDLETARLLAERVFPALDS
ncbi:MAG TPA: LLM class flavin-dependent oxidoreductase [Thermomicrobiales bacterium]|jgi:alkanesulfonate monooxygenase SsuD/methylene tetrahydromethanopterin reductase-like flavin-dependent oxidoreductase (luciferase family)